jgi:hypothetical protein
MTVLPARLGFHSSPGGDMAVRATLLRKGDKVMAAHNIRRQGLRVVPKGSPGVIKRAGGILATVYTVTFAPAEGVSTTVERVKAWEIEKS